MDVKALVPGEGGVGAGAWLVLGGAPPPQGEVGVGADARVVLALPALGLCGGDACGTKTGANRVGAGVWLVLGWAPSPQGEGGVGTGALLMLGLAGGDASATNIYITTWS